ncbi:hypothetical protein SELMODRAFT_414838 [Selaginella moellendorffii]|uniref:Uncharacterized protein n=1 Tax=Selaginella moellendorffii TaxID=88036 RepID=D8RUT5_SELML|nr:hypothetical protein SELMODRAFT_414838 [Selaginella moellendorffii]
MAGELTAVIAKVGSLGLDHVGDSVEEGGATDFGEGGVVRFDEKIVRVWGSGIQCRGAAREVRSNCGGGASEVEGQAPGPVVTQGGRLPRGQGCGDAELVAKQVTWSKSNHQDSSTCNYGFITWRSRTTLPLNRRQKKEEGDDDEEGEENWDPNYFSLSHKDAKWLMSVKLNLKVFLVKYFNILDEFLVKKASNSPTFFADSDALEEEAHKEDPTDGVDPPGDATQVPESSGK